MEPSGRRSKKASKKKQAKTRGQKAPRLAEDANMPDDNCDNESVASMSTSIVTSGSDDHDSFENIADADSDLSDYSQSDFEQKLIDSIEGAGEKSAKSRQANLQQIRKALAGRVLTDFVAGRRETLLDVVERCLKRGQKEDKIIASAIGCLLCVQLGEFDSASVFKALKSILITLINDSTLSAAARGSCAVSLGLCCFIGAEELQEIVECLNVLQSVFKKKVPSDPNEQAALSSAVLAWGLLLTVSSATVQQRCIDENLGTIYNLLEKGDLGLRIAAGEVVALLYELGRDIDESFNGDQNGLYNLLKDLATDSSRHRGKREKKQQRSSFRDVLRAVEKLNSIQCALSITQFPASAQLSPYRVQQVPAYEKQQQDGSVPNDTVKFGSEQIDLFSWTRIRQYNALKEVLEAGINTHLQENILLRDIFDLGLPIVKDVKNTKESRWARVILSKNSVSSPDPFWFKLQPDVILKLRDQAVKPEHRSFCANKPPQMEQLSNATASKERTKSRNKVRDNKRAAHGF